MMIPEREVSSQLSNRRIEESKRVNIRSERSKDYMHQTIFSVIKSDLISMN